MPSFARSARAPALLTGAARAEPARRSMLMNCILMDWGM